MSPEGTRGRKGIWGVPLWKRMGLLSWKVLGVPPPHQSRPFRRCLRFRHPSWTGQVGDCGLVLILVPIPGSFLLTEQAGPQDLTLFSSQAHSFPQKTCASPNKSS